MGLGLTNLEEILKHGDIFDAGLLSRCDLEHFKYFSSKAPRMNHIRALLCALVTGAQQGPLWFNFQHFVCELCPNSINTH